MKVKIKQKYMCKILKYLEIEHHISKNSRNKKEITREIERYFQLNKN